MQNSIVINGMSIDQFVSEYNRYKSENERLKTTNGKMQEQLENQGRQLHKLKKDNERYKIKLQEHYGIPKDIL